jgi:hypothetical protein
LIERDNSRPVKDALLAFEDESVVDKCAEQCTADRSKDRAPDPVVAIRKQVALAQ